MKFSGQELLSLLKVIKGLFTLSGGMAIMSSQLSNGERAYLQAEFIFVFSIDQLCCSCISMEH